MMNNERVESIIAVQEERARIGGVEVSKKTLVAATDEGVVAVQVNTVESARGYTYRPALSAPQYRPNPAIDYKDERNCTDYCCLACDSDYEWYTLGGKGCFWYLVLPLLYLIIGVILLPFVILYLVCLCICYPLGCCRNSDDSNAPLCDS